MYISAGTGHRGSLATSPVSSFLIVPVVRESVLDRLSLAVFVPSVDRAR
jgi:hypothetical protein